MRKVFCTLLIAFLMLMCIGNFIAGGWSIYRHWHELVLLADIIPFYEKYIKEYCLNFALYSLAMHFIFTKWGTNEKA